MRDPYEGLGTIVEEDVRADPYSGLGTIVEEPTGRYPQEEINPIVPEQDERGFLGNLKESFQRGRISAASDFAWYSAMNGKIPMEDAENIDREIERIEKEDPVKAKGKISRLFNATARMLGPMAESLAKGATIGSGAALGTAIAGQLGPQAVVPEEVVTVPLAYGIGQTYGSMDYWRKQGAGSIYREIAREGLGGDGAKTVAQLGGTLYAAIELAQVDKIIPGLGKKMEDAAKLSVRKGLTNLVKKYGANVLKETGEEMAQKVVSDASVDIQKALEGQLALADVPQEVRETAISAFREGLSAMGPLALLTAGGAAVGARNIIKEGQEQAVTAPTEAQVPQEGVTPPPLPPEAIDAVQPLLEPSTDILQPGLPEGEPAKGVAVPLSIQERVTTGGEIPGEKATPPISETRGPLEPIKEPAQKPAVTPEPAPVSDKLEKGVGAAIKDSSEFVKAEEQKDVTSLKESVAEIEREALGFTPEIKDAARRFPKVFAEAQQKIDESPSAGENLVNELAETPRPTSDIDGAMLALEKVKRIKELNSASEKTVSLAEKGTDAQKEAAQKDHDVALRRVNDLFNVVAQSGRATSRGLGIFRALVDDNYSVVSMERSVMSKQGGKDLSKEQKGEVKRIHKEYADARKEFEAKVGKLEGEAKTQEEELSRSRAEATFAEAVAQIATDPKKASPFRKKMLSTADRLRSEGVAELKEMGGRLTAGVDPARLVSMSKVGASYIIEGTYKVSDWMAKMRKTLGDISTDVLNKVREMSVKLASQEKSTIAQADVVGKKTDSKTEQNKIIKELFKTEVESGVTELSEAVNNVHALIGKDFGMTPEQMRDEFSDYGKARPLNRTETAKTLADLRRQSQLLASIERVMNKLHALKSGPQRDKPSQRVRQLTRILNKLTKEAGLQPVNTEAQLASALSAVKTRLQNSIDDIDKAIKTGERIVADKGTVEYDAEANALKAKRDALKEQYDKMFPKQPMTDEQRLGVALKAAERSLDRQNQRLRYAKLGKFLKIDRKAMPASKRLDAIRAERDAVKEEVDRLRELAEPGKAAIEAKIKRLNTSIAKMEQRIKEKDFTTREKEILDISESPEAMQAQMKLESVKGEFEGMKEEARRASRTFDEVVGESALEVMDAQRNILASYDLSAAGRQSWYAILSHPIVGMKNTVKMFKAMKRGESAKMGEQLRNRTNYRKGYYQKAKLGLVDDDGTGNFTQVEDRFRLNLVEKVPGMNLSNRTFATLLNGIRADLFDVQLAKNPGDTSTKRLKAIAETVNTITGRGDFGAANPESWSRWIWAPRFLKSSFDILTLRPLRTGTKESKTMFAKEFTRVMGSLTAIYAVYSLFKGDDDEPIEWDPRSSRFGAMPIGKHYFNPIGFVRPMLTFMARAISGVTKTAAGKRKLREYGTLFDEGAEKEKYGAGLGIVAWRFLQSKAHPFVGTSMSVATGKQYGGREPTTPGSVARSLVVPLAPREAYEIINTEDKDAAVVLSMMVMLGLDVKPDYDSPEYLKFVAKDEEAYKKAAGRIIYNATAPKATESQKARAVKMMGGISGTEAESVFRHYSKSQHKTLDRITSSAKDTAYGRRYSEYKRLRSKAKRK